MTAVLRTVLSTYTIGVLCMTLRTILTLSVLSVGLACGGSNNDTTAPSASAYVGTYTLTQLNGTALPTSLVEGQTTYQASAGTAQITSSNTWTATFTATPSNVTLSGTYTVTSSGLNLVQTGVSGSGSTAVLSSSNVLTVTTSATPITTFTFTKNTTGS